MIRSSYDKRQMMCKLGYNDLKMTYYTLLPLSLDRSCKTEECKENCGANSVAHSCHLQNEKAGKQNKINSQGV